MISRFLLVTALLVLAAALNVSGQPLKRIQFAKGTSSATVKGSTGNSGTTYVVGARSGQKIVITITPRAGVGVKVEHDGRFGHEVLLREDRGGTYEVGLEESGDYTILLGSSSGRPAAYTMTVKIVKMTDI
jgi:hypothetical protein